MRYLTIAVLLFFFWWSPLSFIPFPWPDDGSFYFPGVDLVSQHPHFASLSLSPFVPSYAQANFNIMPLQAVFMGILHALGADTLRALRLSSIFALFIFIYFLGKKLERFSISKNLILLFIGVIASSPSLRWGSMIVRPEIWVGLAWAIVLMSQLKGYRPWVISAGLGLSALSHYEAVFMVIPTLFLLWDRDPKVWFKKISEITLKTLLFLSPWILYVLTNLPLFKEQFLAHFNRLSEGHAFLNSFYDYFHSMFPSYWSPLSFPKYYNPAKFLYWTLILVTVFKSFHLSLQKKSPLLWAALLGHLFTHILWLRFPETWYTTLIHVSFFSLLALTLIFSEYWFKKVVFVLLILLLPFQLILTSDQIKTLWPHYSQKRYSTWVDCIHAQIGDRKIVWQPGWPDALIDLSARDFSRHYYRANDFSHTEDLEKIFVKEKVEALLITTAVPLSENFSQRLWNGLPQKDDLQFLSIYPWIAKKYYTNTFSSQKTWVCQQGPLWAYLLLK